MKEQGFTLRPFSSDAVTPEITISGIVRRNESTIEIDYVISGDLQDIIIPSTAGTPMRKDNLWKETCLEAFFAPADSDHYWEVNLSPGGHWNVYPFTAYRDGMKEEAGVKELPIFFERNDASLKISANIDLGKLISDEDSLHVGVSAVIKSKSGILSYWALAHPGPEPDFHNRESFILQV